MTDDEPVKHPYRDLGAREENPERKNPQNEIEKAPPELKQSVYQTPIEISAEKPELPPELQAEIERKKQAQEALIQKWMEKRKMHCLGSAIVLAFASAIFASLAMKSWIAPTGAAFVGAISGAIIGYQRMGDVMAKIVHVLPQILWSTICLGVGWVFPGIGLMAAIFAWLVHLVLATMVSMKIQLDESAVV